MRLLIFLRRDEVSLDEGSHSSSNVGTVDGVRTRSQVVLIRFGRRNCRQLIAFFNPVTFIHVDIIQVPAYFRIKSGGVEWNRLPDDLDSAIPRGPLHPADSDFGACFRLRLKSRLLVVIGNFFDDDDRYRREKKK